MEKFVYMYIKPGSLWTSVYPNIIINSGPFTCLKWIHLMVLFLFRPTKSVATHNISPRLIQIKTNEEAISSQGSLHLSSHNRKTPIRPVQFLSKNLYDSHHVFLFFLSGGQHRRIYMNQDREVHIDWTAINAPYFLPFVGPSKKTA